MAPTLRFVYLTLLVSFCALSSTLALSFDEWVLRHNKSYSSTEEIRYRRSVFASNARIIERHNAQPHKTFTMGFTPFVDLTNDEFRKFVRSSSPFPLDTLTSSSTSTFTASLSSFPPSVDWSDKGYVSPVKNTECSAVVDELSGAVESAAAILNGKLRLLDEAQLSCAGCGCSCQVMDIVPYLLAHGMTYTYKTGNCNYHRDVNVTEFPSVSPNNETALLEAIAMQPVMVGVEADSPAFQMYTEGVLTDTSCGANIDHVLLAVGYGTDNSVDYYRARNSWGESWGEKGYIRIGRGAKFPAAGECGIQSYITMPLVKLN